MIVPISTELQKSYRDTLSIPGAPAFLDTDERIIPVAVVAQTSVASTSQYVRPTDGTDNLSIAGDGSIAVSPTAPLPPGATYISKAGYFDLVNTAVDTLYTPTSGKTLYITEFSACSDNAGIFVYGDNIAVTETINTVYDNKGYIPIGSTIDFGEIKVLLTPFKVATALKAHIARAATGNVRWSFTGYEI